ncbi:hypothetical protein AZI86_00600 [Bdellovibrio bacteriovorus]|uniref:Uncharacterized protein n=1 Tax=Bdellovibrio bacteriovorus TaxID=959 RepID=A0A150WT79_BDEBC|nr:hypothetical protein AZI86_00600 [Bdellovibrio bacteriovorus]
MYVVELSRTAQKQVSKLPHHVRDNFHLWVFGVRTKGLAEMRKISGYHDEPLVGVHRRQRSIRLNRSYRAIYEIKDNGEIEFIEIIEVNKHDYR